MSRINKYVMPASNLHILSLSTFYFKTYGGQDVYQIRNTYYSVSYNCLRYFKLYKYRTSEEIFRVQLNI